MEMSRLRLALALALVVTPCLAQDYPVRPVKVIDGVMSGT